MKGGFFSGSGVMLKSKGCVYHSDRWRGRWIGGIGVQGSCEGACAGVSAQGSCAGIGVQGSSCVPGPCLAPSDPKESGSARQRTDTAVLSLDLSPYLLVISIHREQLITGEELPETKQVVQLSVAGTGGVETSLLLAGAHLAWLEGELTRMLGSGVATAPPRGQLRKGACQSS